MQYASKFTELSRFVPDFVVTKRMKMRRFEKGLAFYILHQLDGQPIHTYQDVYEPAAEVERVKIELRAINPNPSHPKRKWTEWGTLSESVNQNVKKPAPALPNIRTIVSAEPYGKCRQTNHTTFECRVRTKKCF